MRKIYLSIFTSLLLMLGLVNVAQADEYLRIGMEAAYAPFNWTQDDDSNGAVKIDGTNQYANGYDVQIAKKIAKDLGKEPLVVKTKWEGLVPALTSGKIDMIIAGMSPTAERKQEIAFSSSYYTSEPVLLVKKILPTQVLNLWMTLTVQKSLLNKGLPLRLDCTNPRC